MAAREGRADAVTMLMSVKADLDAQDDQCSTALHYAAEQGHSETITALLACPTLQLDVQDADGDTPLHLAAHGVNVIRGRQHVSVVEQLVKRDASIYVERKNGRRAFELTKNKEIRALLEPKSNGSHSVTPARRNADLFELPPPPDSVVGKRLRGTNPNWKPSPMVEDYRIRTTPKKIRKTGDRTMNFKNNSQIDADFFGALIDDDVMYQQKASKKLLSGRYLRMWLVQTGVKDDAATQRSQWEKTDLDLWEPSMPAARRTVS